MVLNGIEISRVTSRETSEVLGLSLRHVRRILAEYRRKGAAALAHGNRGSKPHNALDCGLKRRVLELAQSFQSVYR
jgi:transposase